jgi:hypothetical protein
MVQAIETDKGSFAGVHEWANKNSKACIPEVSLIVVVYGKGSHWSLVVIGDSSTLDIDCIKLYHNINIVKNFLRVCSESLGFGRHNQII